MARPRSYTPQLWVRSRILGPGQSPSRPERRPPRRSVSATTARSWTSSRSRCWGMRVPGRSPSRRSSRCSRARSRSVRITFRPPRSSDVPAGPMAFGVRVASQEDPGGSVVEEGVLQVGAFADTSAELAPRTSRGRTGATHDLAVDNRGNTPLNATITGLDPDRVGHVRHQAAQRGGRPGHRDVREGRASSPASASGADSPRRARSSCSSTAPVSRPSSSAARCSRSRCCRRGSSRRCCCSLAALIALVLIWFLFLRPVIQSTAQERTDAALQQAGIQPPTNPGGSQPGGGGGQPTPTPAPGQTSAPPVPTPTPGPAGVETPRDGRVPVNSDPVSPTAGRTLYITDLVFSNPNGATGALRLRRSGQDLMVLRLENFRDLDFHFVSPIVVGPGQQLRLVCEADRAHATAPRASTSRDTNASHGPAAGRRPARCTGGAGGPRGTPGAGRPGGHVGIRGHRPERVLRPGRRQQRHAGLPRTSRCAATASIPARPWISTSTSWARSRSRTPPTPGPSTTLGVFDGKVSLLLPGSSLAYVLTAVTRGQDGPAGDGPGRRSLPTDRRGHADLRGARRPLRHRPSWRTASAPAAACRWASTCPPA